MTECSTFIKKNKAHICSILVIATAACTMMLTGCKTKAETKNTENIGNTDELIQEAYELKKTGHNARALQNLEKACKVLESSAPRSANHGSCLDDLASVHMRMGEMDKAALLYDQAKEILSADKGSDPRLINGIQKRRELIEIMKKAGATCLEPGEPASNSEIPYFPDIAEMQAALGKMNPEIAICSDGAPEAVTVRAVITGDGKLLRAEARGPQADTELGSCVVDKMKAAMSRATLPKFRACFRGFTYPYMVGQHATPVPQQ